MNNQVNLTLKKPKKFMSTNNSRKLKGKVALVAGASGGAMNGGDRASSSNPKKQMRMNAFSVTYGPDTSGHAQESAEDLIRKRAYENFQSRGGGDGSALENWLRAEREIKQHLD